MEVQAKALRDQLTAEAAPIFDAKRQEIAERGERLVQFGLPLPPGFSDSLAGVTAAAATTDWAGVVGRLGQLHSTIQDAQSEFSARLRTEARAFAEWAGETPEGLADLDARLRTAVEPVADGRLGEGRAAVERLVVRQVPDAVARRDAARTMGLEILASGRDLGVPTAALEGALQADAEVSPLDWPRSVVAVEGEAGQLTDVFREKVGQVVQSLGRTLESLREYDVDPTASLVVVEEVGQRVPTAGPNELPKLLTSARAATEEPVVAIVASLLDSVRPKLVEARRLGRDASEVFAAMNRAREALRLKIFSEALAASQEAMDRVHSLTEDLDTARAEAESLRALLGRLTASRFPTAPHTETVDRIFALLDRVELPEARRLLADAVQRLGAETVAFFSERFADLERVFQVAQERGFLPPGAEEELAGARRLLEEGQLAEAAEHAARVEVAVRGAAGPYVARRVEELEAGFREIPDESLVAPVRRLLADADVTLRVKGDLSGSIESLRRAEREFSAVFAAHASTLVEMLEEERKVLEAMGGTGDEIQRQIDEVQQIFNMGDFVKASRTSQEIRTRAQQQQLIRSEEAVSHAKLALVELGKMGVDPGALRGDFDRAQALARDGQYAEAYGVAGAVEASVGRTKAKAQGILDGMSEVADRFQVLKDAGVVVDGFREQLRLTRIAYQALEFDAALQHLDGLRAALATASAEAESRRLVAEGRLLAEDAERLGLDTSALRAQSAELARALEEGRFADGESRARAVHDALVQILQPVLADHLATVEQEFEIARSTGIDVTEVLELLTEARRRLALPVPTGVADVLDRARSKLVESRGFLEHAERVVRRARTALSEAELARVNVHAALEQLAVVETALAEKEYARVIELASTLEREMIQATGQQVGRALGGVQAAVARARHEGSDTTVAENLVRQARTALEEGRPLDALQKASLAGGELERVELQRRIADGAIQAMELKLASARREGVRLPSAERELDAARTALGQHHYSDVLEHAIAVSEQLEESRAGFRRARDALDAADRQAREAREMGVDLGEVLPVLDRARSAHGEGAYAEAVELARDAAQAARWALERQYAQSLAEVRQLVETADQRGAADGLGPAQQALAEADAAFAARDWSQARDALDRARGAVREALSDLVRDRIAALYPEGSDAPLPPVEAEARVQLRARLDQLVEASEYAGALDLVASEGARLRAQRQQEYEGRLAELKDRLWIGEKLGLDTTPVMELFSEAGLAVAAGRFDPVVGLLAEAETKLMDLVGGRLSEKLDEVTTELNFAREGLHVAVEPVAQRLETVGRQLRSGDPLAAGRGLLDAEEELNRRKALHRELMNLHYLIDAALARATERRLDTTPARALLEESLQLRESDYVVALAKAREALQQLQNLLKTTETATGFWALRRPPSSS